jgi:hypothetical protein
VTAPLATAPIGFHLATAFVHAVYDHRFLTAPQLARLYQLDYSTTKSILDRLTGSDHLAAVRRPVLHRAQPDTVYALGQAGANQVAADLGIDRRLVRWRKYHNLVGLPYVEHRLATNDVRIAFTVGSRRLGVVLEHWRYEVPIKEDVDDPDEGGPPLVMRPDAYLRLLAGPRRLHFFLETDMGTETHGRFALKIRHYLAYKEAALFRRRVGGKAFRMLTVATTTTRVASLKRIAEGEGAQRAFWFAMLSDITPETVGDPIWKLAGERTKAALFGPSVSSVA